MNPSGLVYRCFTKATTQETGSPRFSTNWALARRAWLSVFADRLECGDWVIPAASVKDAVQFRIRSLVGGSVLQVTTTEATYQFGLNPWVRIGPHLPFPFREESVAMRYSVFSVAIRLAILAILVYQVWRRWFAV